MTTTLPARIPPATRNVALLVAACFFMENLDATVITTAAPQMGAELGVAPASIGLLVSTYLVTIAALIPFSAWLSHRFQPRTVFLSAIAVFTAASLGCALASDLPTLVAMRVVQGLGGAMMVPVGRTLVLAAAEKTHVVKLIAFIIWPGLLAFPLAPIIGALVVTYASWPWIFLLNIPVGLGALAFGLFVLPRRPDDTPAPPLDVTGLALTVTALAALTAAASLVADGHPTARRLVLAAVCALVGVVAGGAGVRHLLRAPHPLVDLRVFAVRSFGVSQAAMTAFFVAVGAAPYLLPLLLQLGYGWSPLLAGAVTVSVFLGNIGAKPVTTPLMHRYGFRAVAIAACAGLAVTTAALGLVPPSAPFGALFAVGIAAGAFRSIGLSAYAVITMADVTPAQLRSANALTSTVQQLGMGYGIAVSAIGLTIGTAFAGGVHTAYAVAFVLAGACAAVAGVVSTRLSPDTGSALLSR